MLLTLPLLLLAGCQERRTANAVPPQAGSSSVPLFEPTYLPYAQTNLQRMKLYVGMKEVNAELALKPVEIFTGMMWRTNMNDGDGMLFVFPEVSPRSFYMRNTLVPLSIAYIDPDGVIQEIYDMQPRTETPVPSKSANIQYVLEVPQGWFARNQIVPGTLVRSQYGEFKKIFTFSRSPR